MRKRFIDDLKLPIPVIEDPYWDFFLDLYEKDWQSRTKWETLKRFIEDGSTEKFLEEFYKVRENMINFIKDSEGYKKFQEAELPNIKYPQVNKGDIYNEGRVGKQYIGIDLEKANFQVLREYIDFTKEKVNPTVDWGYWVEDVIKSKNPGLTWYMKQSKYLRQVVFGNCNPGRQINMEKSRVWKATQEIIKRYEGKVELVQLGSDEACLEILDEQITTPLEDLREMINKNLGLFVKVNRFKLSSTLFLTPSNHTIRAYCKEHMDGKKEWKGIQKHYHAQIYELLNGISPDKDEKDLVFYNEKEIAKFIGRIKLA